MNSRIRWLRNQLISLDLEGMIVSNPVNIKYLTGLDEEGTLVITPKENIFITDSRYTESVNRHLTLDDEIVVFNMNEMSKYDYEGIFMTNESVGFEENYVTYSEYMKMLQRYQVELTETDGLIENQRVIKDEDEIESIKKACRITDDTFEHIKKFIKLGMTEREIAFEIDRYMITHGAEGTSFNTIVAFLENASMPHAVPSDRRLRSKDMIQLDFGCKVDGYCSDFSRVIFIDEIDDRMKETYDFVLEEQMKIADGLKDGANIKTVIKDRETDYRLENEVIMHSFGHGVGLEVHESPILRARQDCTIKENTIIAIEPGVYYPNNFGIRIEDIYIVKKDGCRPLTTSSKDYTIIKLS